MPTSNDNPFAQRSPFSDPSVSAYTGKHGHSGSGVPAAGAWGSGGNGGAWGSGAPVVATIQAEADTGSNLPSGSPLNVEDLERREKELAAKEAELQRWEADLRATGGLKPKNNWPVCFPIVYLDIDAEVPADLQSSVRKAYWTYLGMAACMVWNFFGSLMALIIIGNGDGRLTGWFLAIIYMVAGIPLGWWLWFKRLYNAAKKDRALSYAVFFLIFAVHCAFCVWSAVAPPLPSVNNWSHTGFIACISAFKANKFVGVLYVIGGAAWTVESLLSIWVLKLVTFKDMTAKTQIYSAFRGGGGEQRLRREVASTAARHAASHV